MRKSPQTYGINLSCDNPRRAENSKLNLISTATEAAASAFEMKQTDFPKTRSQYRR